MQWLPQGLPLRRWVQRCISRFFSTNNWKNIYVRTTTPDMHPVCDIFTFLDSNVFYIAYKGKSISWIFINFVHWNCSQTVDPPLLKDSDKSLICLQHFSPLPIFRAFHYGFTQEGRRKDHDLRMKHFVPFFFLFSFFFIMLFFFFFFQTPTALTGPKDQLALLIFNPSAFAFPQVLPAFCWNYFMHGMLLAPSVWQRWPHIISLQEGFYVPPMVQSDHLFF